MDARYTQHRRVASAWPAAIAAAAILAVLFFTSTARAQPIERSGKEVVDQVCANCHRTGVNGAPRIGDRKAWSKRSEQGLAALTSHALEGIRNMPPHGGNFKMTDVEIQRGITYMVNQSGGHWTEPSSRTIPIADRSGEAVVKARCVECHGEGKMGAPKVGDRSAWIPRLQQGFDSLVRSAINGHGAMPPRGGMASLTDNEVRNAIAYMVGAPAAPK
jgi:cytochrome c5